MNCNASFWQSSDSMGTAATPSSNTSSGSYSTAVEADDDDEDEETGAGGTVDDDEATMAAAGAGEAATIVADATLPRGTSEGETGNCRLETDEASLATSKVGAVLVTAFNEEELADAPTRDDD